MTAPNTDVLRHITVEGVTPNTETIAADVALAHLAGFLYETSP